MSDADIIQFPQRRPAGDALSLSHGHERGAVRICFQLRTGFEICGLISPEDARSFAEGVFFESLLAQHADEQPADIPNLPDPSS